MTWSPARVCDQRLITPVQMCDGDDLASDVVVEPVDAIGVDEAVADPDARLHRLLNFTQNLQQPPATMVSTSPKQGQRRITDVL